MLKKVYSVRDAKGDVYNQPFYQNTHGEAERTLVELVKDQRTFVAKYPEDFDLYYLGDFDDKTGMFMPLSTPLHIVKAMQLVANKSQDVKVRPELHVPSAETSPQ